MSLIHRQGKKLQVSMIINIDCIFNHRFSTFEVLHHSRSTKHTQGHTDVSVSMMHGSRPVFFISAAYCTVRLAPSNIPPLTLR